MVRYVSKKRKLRTKKAAARRAREARGSEVSLSCWSQDRRSVVIVIAGVHAHVRVFRGAGVDRSVC